MSEHQVRMKRVYGDDVIHGDVFAVTHMRVVDPEQPPRWVDARSESTYNDYRSCVETEVAEGRLEVEGEKLPWCPHIWKEVATRGRKKRGARVYGFGERGLSAILPSKPSDLSQSSPSNARSYQFLRDDRYQRIVEENVLIRAEIERIIAEAECTRLEAERTGLEAEATRLEAQLEAQRSRVAYDQMQAEFRAFMENWRLSNFDTPSSQV